MKNSKLLSIVLVTIVSLSVIFMGKEVLAAQDLTTSTNLNDLTSSSSGNSSLNSSNTSSTSLNKNSTISNSSSSKNNTTNSTANNVLRTTNTSSVNSSNLPKTGIEDSMPGVILIVVLAISAIYAYKKIQDYRNI